MIQLNPQYEAIFDHWNIDEDYGYPSYIRS